MKHAKLAVLLAFVTTLIGCATFYKGTVAITDVVKMGMQMWAQESVAGRSTPEIDAKVIAAYEKYQQAARTARLALVAYKETGDDAAFIKALAVVQASADGLFDLIMPLLDKGKADSLESQLKGATAL